MLSWLRFRRPKVHPEGVALAPIYNAGVALIKALDELPESRHKERAFDHLEECGWHVQEILLKTGVR
jgi:hypothetical protein